MLEIDATKMLNKIRKQNLLDSKGKESGKKSGQKRWSEKVVGKGGQKRWSEKQSIVVQCMEKNSKISRKNLSQMQR